MMNKRTEMITKELVVQWLDAATFSQLSDHRAMAMHIAQRAYDHGAAQMQERCAVSAEGHYGDGFRLASEIRNLK